VVAARSKTRICTPYPGQTKCTERRGDGGGGTRWWRRVRGQVRLRPSSGKRHGTANRTASPPLSTTAVNSPRRLLPLVLHPTPSQRQPATERIKPPPSLTPHGHRIISCPPAPVFLPASSSPAPPLLLAAAYRRRSPIADRGPPCDARSPADLPGLTPRR
jgi:hypothetical protein